MYETDHIFDAELKMKKAIPNPDTKLCVIKRYLHVLALLQNSADPMDWNASTLADILSLDESGDPLSDKSVRDYIQKHLVEELNIDVNVRQGGKKTQLIEQPSEEMMAVIASVYAAFVVRDSGRDMLLKNLLKKHRRDGLWLLARIYFSALEKRKIRFNYYSNASARTRSHIVHPYHIIFRNNNLYLAAWSETHAKQTLFIVNRIQGLVVLSDTFEEKIPRLDSIFKDTLGSFIGKKHTIRLRFHKNLFATMEDILGTLEPKICETDNAFEAIFTVSDAMYLCKQLFMYGNRVEILEPVEIRNTMVSMLKESLSVY